MSDTTAVRVLVFYDEEGWAWWHRAHFIQRNLSPAVELDILQNGKPFDHTRYDLILLFEHYLLNQLPPGVPRDKIILGSSCPRLTHETMERMRAENCKAGMVNSLGIFQQVRHMGRVFCCQNGVDADFFQPAPARPGRPQACWVGNSKSIGNKGLDLIREACAAEGVPLQVLDKAEMAATWTQTEVRDHVYHQSTFYICASEFEGTPNPMLESLACGLPVISTRVGNAPEILRDGYNGYLVERSAESIAAAIRKLLACDGDALSRNARVSILEGWTWKRRAAPYEAMFLELASESRRNSPSVSTAPKREDAPRSEDAPAQGFAGMVQVPFLANKAAERALCQADLQAKAEALKRNPADFNNVLSAALDCIRLGKYPLARDFTVCASQMTPYYNEVIRDLSLHLRAWEKNRKNPVTSKATEGLGQGKIHIAMLTYNALAYTKQCLHALLTRTRRPLEIHIRENASKDATPLWLRELNHPRVHVEYGDDNRGVPGGRNRLIEMIRPVAGPEDFVVFLDNDIEVLEGWEDHFLDFFARHPEAGIASAIGHRFIVVGATRRVLPLDESGPSPVDVACGGYACWMRAPAMLSGQKYDENLGLFWHEDDDFCVQSLAKGIDVWAVPGAPLIHHGHKSGVALEGHKEGGSLKNQAYLTDKWRRMGMILPSGEVDRSQVTRKIRNLDVSQGDEAGKEGKADLGPGRPGFNIIGDSGGRGEAADAVLKAARTLRSLGYSVAESGGAAPLTHEINLFIFPSSDPRAAADIRREGRLNVAFPAEGRTGDSQLASMDMVLASALLSKDWVYARIEEFFRAWKTDRTGPSDWVPGPRPAAMRVLLQNRPTADAAPGGDTMVMDRYRDGLRNLGMTVDVRHDSGADYRRYDMVHLFNLVLPETVEPMAAAAAAAGTPFVAQAIQEDQEAYQGRSLTLAHILASYVRSGQPRELLPKYLELMRHAEATATQSSPFAAANARAIFCNSEAEAGYVKRLHPSARTTVVPYGVDDTGGGPGPELFEKTFGMKDFILCVGRLEPRKNQLALLAALEEEDVPLVLADGGVCYMPAYADVARAFRRRGRTVFTGRMNREMLISCFRAATAHVLPSWQELPGLVTLEAAALGCNVAATPHGGIHEYMGEYCDYFQPDDLDGIRKAALAAWQAPRTGRSAEIARAFTWAKSVEGVAAGYRAILAGAPSEARRAVI
jgi:glycosyltransferase involved in cell wall biosynthesis/GT2 family glycosyltransferase